MRWRRRPSARRTDGGTGCNRGKLRFKQRQPLVQVLVAVGGHGQRQFAGLLEAGEFLGRYQVVLEVLELARPLYPDVARA
jgi:hypothetical protein